MDFLLYCENMKLPGEGNLEISRFEFQIQIKFFIQVWFAKFLGQICPTGMFHWMCPDLVLLNMNEKICLTRNTPCIGDPPGCLTEPTYRVWMSHGTEKKITRVTPGFELWPSHLQS
jgi:hypothetical protein